MSKRKSPVRGRSNGTSLPTPLGAHLEHLDGGLHGTESVVDGQVRSGRATRGTHCAGVLALAPPRVVARTGVHCDHPASTPPAGPRAVRHPSAFSAARDRRDASTAATRDHGAVSAPLGDLQPPQIARGQTAPGRTRARPSKFRAHRCSLPLALTSALRRPPPPPSDPSRPRPIARRSAHVARPRGGHRPFAPRNTHRESNRGLRRTVRFLFPPTRRSALVTMATNAASAYRTVLRTLRNNVRSVKNNADFETFVKSEFRRLAASGRSPRELQGYAELARDFAFLNQAIRHHKVREEQRVSGRRRGGCGGIGRRAGAQLGPCPFVPQEILLSYNIGIDPDVRAKEGYRRAAHRVGLELPNYAPKLK